MQRIVVVTLGILALAGPALAQRAEVVGSSVALRTAPETRARVMRMLRTGDQLDVLERRNGWTRLKQPAGDGWAQDSGLRFPTANTAATPARLSISNTSLSLNLARAQPPGAQLASAGRATQSQTPASQSPPPTPRPSLRLAPTSSSTGSSPTAASAGPPRVRVGDVFVARQGVNVRSGPGARFRELGALDAGDSITVEDWIGPWYGFDFAGQRGWVHKGNLRSGPYTGALALGDPTNPQRMGAIVTPAPAGSASPSASAGSSSNASGQPATRPNGTTTRAALAAASQAASNASQSTPPSSQTTPGTGQPPPSNPNRPVSRAGFVQLAASGPGFYSYTSAGNRWGLPNMVYGIERVGRRWEPLNRPRIGTGDLSYENGGRMRGHVSHRKGEDVDVRPVRNDGGERPVTINQRAYSREFTRELINLFYDEHGSNFDLCLFNDAQTDHTRYYANHHNHFHLRIHK